MDQSINLFTQSRPARPPAPRPLPRASPYSPPTLPLLRPLLDGDKWLTEAIRAASLPDRHVAYVTPGPGADGSPRHSNPTSPPAAAITRAAAFRPPHSFATVAPGNHGDETFIRSLQGFSSTSLQGLPYQILILIKALYIARKVRRNYGKTFLKLNAF